MKLNSIQADNFMSFDCLTFEDFPPQGITVLTGNNGAGKSALIEAIAYGVYGRTIRGDSPWRNGEAGSLHVSTCDGLHVHRTVTKSGTKKLTAYYNDKPLEGTPSKVQEKINEIVIPFEEWMQTQVFTADDALRFSLSTDAERKRFIESVFGLERLDKAYALALTELQIAKAKLDIADRSVTAKKLGYDSAYEAWKNESDRVIPAFQEPSTPLVEAPTQSKPSETALSEIAETTEQLRSDIARLRMARDSIRPSIELSQEKMAAKMELESVEKELRLIKSGKCPTCSRAFESTHLVDAGTRQSALESRYLKAIEKCDEDSKKCESDRAEILNQIVRHEYELQTLQQKTMAVSALTLEWKTYEQASKRHESYISQLRTAHENEVAGLSSRIVGLSKAVQSANDAMEKASAEQSKAKADVSIKEAVSKVLGTKGMRSRMLNDCLTGLQNVANYWLSRMGGMTIALSSTSEKKDGKGTFDAISLTIKGAKCSSTYKGLSTGERRRVDAAIILSLAEVVGAIHKNESHMIAFDEVFDSLDADGVASVSSALKELSEHRAVLVVTHSRDLAKSIEGTRYQVEKGRISHA